MYGNTVERSQWTPQRSVVGEIETSAAGNVILRVGREVESNEASGLLPPWAIEPGWQQTEHVVLTPDEARELAAELARLATTPA